MSEPAFQPITLQPRRLPVQVRVSSDYIPVTIGKDDLDKQQQLARRYYDILSKAQAAVIERTILGGEKGLSR